jgi:hypothetical protein
MTIKTPSTHHVDWLDATREPTEEALAAVMADVSRVVKEKRNMAYVKLHETVTDELKQAQARADYLRKQFKVARL